MQEFKKQIPAFLPSLLNPGILGVPAVEIPLGSFHFGTCAGGDAEKFLAEKTPG
ncbi:MAG TPA: hypothetical protein VMV89_00635 [Candidatus Paceibacterota bacterium]|nr:hypothetical protein [Candidatus Paceibacterota bacterium]